MNAISKGLLGAALLAAFGASHASPIYYTVNGGATQQLDVTPITDTFTGTSTVTSGFCNLSCTLSATGTLSDNLSGNTTLSVSAASTSGSFACNTVNLSGFPWVGSVPHSSIPSPLAPVTFTLSGVNVSSICGTCSNQIDVTFDPASGGSFVFNGPITPNGSCAVVGNLTSTNYYVATH